MRGLTDPSHQWQAAAWACCCPRCCQLLAGRQRRAGDDNTGRRYDPTGWSTGAALIKRLTGDPATGMNTAQWLATCKTDDAEAYQDAATARGVALPDATAIHVVRSFFCRLFYPGWLAGSLAPTCRRCCLFPSARWFVCWLHCCASLTLSSTAGADSR